MDFVLGASNFSYGDLNQFCLEMGMSVSAFSNRNSRRRNVLCRAGPVGIKYGATVSCMFIDQYLRGSKKSTGRTPEEVAYLISLSIHTNEQLEPDGTVVQVVTEDTKRIRLKRRTQREKLK